MLVNQADLIFTYGYEKNLKDLKTHIPKRCQCLLMAATSRFVCVIITSYKMVFPFLPLQFLHSINSDEIFAVMMLKA